MGQSFKKEFYVGLNRPDTSAIGTPVPAPNKNFQVISPNHPNIPPRLDPTKFNSDVFINPFTNQRQGKSGVAGQEYYGGKGDLLPTISTRAQATGLLDSLLSRNPQNFVNDITKAGAQMAGKDPLLSEAYQNYTPQVGSDMFVEDEKNRSGLRDLLRENYVQGGRIWGSAIANEGTVNNFIKARDARKKAQIIAPFAGIPFVGGVIGGIANAG